MLGSEGDEVPTGEGPLQVLQQHRVLAHRVDPHPGERPRLEADAVPAAENLRMRHRLEELVHAEARRPAPPEGLNPGKATTAEPRWP